MGHVLQSHVRADLRLTRVFQQLVRQAGNMGPPRPIRSQCLLAGQKFVGGLFVDDGEIGALKAEPGMRRMGIQELRRKVLRARQGGPRQHPGNDAKAVLEQLPALRQRFATRQNAFVHVSLAGMAALPLLQWPPAEARRRARGAVAQRARSSLTPPAPRRCAPGLTRTDMPLRAQALNLPCIPIPPRGPDRAG